MIARGPSRIQLSRGRGWRLPPSALTVARPTIFGNPWKVGDPGLLLVPDPERARSICAVPLPEALSTEGAAANFRAWLEGRATLRPSRLWCQSVPVDDYMRQRRRRLDAALPALRGFDLACWCPPDSCCHADVLLEMANGPLVG